MVKYCKNCPSCNKEMLYNNKYALNNSIKNDRNCKSCCQLKYEYTTNFNRNACKIFDKLNNELNLNGHHAMNGGEKEISGYFVDYYEPIHNMVIEWDEPAHYENGKLKSKDIERQQIIEKKLKCNFIRVNQDNFNYDELKGKITKNCRLSCS